MIVRSAGFVTADLIGAQNNLIFAYVLYLRGRDQGPPPPISSSSCAAGTPSQLTRRYSKGNPETDIDYDIRQIDAQGLKKYCEASILTPAQPQLLGQPAAASSSTRLRRTAPSSSPTRLPNEGGRQRLSLARHHGERPLAKPQRRAPCLPEKPPEGSGPQPWGYNQIANFVLAQSEINIAIGNKPPEKYFAELVAQCDGVKKVRWHHERRQRCVRTFGRHCLPETMLDGEIPAYDDFLDQRRKLMALKVKQLVRGALMIS